MIAPLLAAAAISLNGSVQLRSVDFDAHCLRVDAAGAKVVECGRAGTFAGSGLRGTATYTWHWHLWHGGESPQTARGDEDGTVVLRLGTRGTVRLTLRGTKTSGRSSGTWRYASGTRQLARRRGTGTYRFETSASPGGFRTARIVLRGTLR